MTNATGPVPGSCCCTASGRPAAAGGPWRRRSLKHHEVVRLDLPGHGDSAGVTADLPATGRLAAEAGGPAVYIGYSMGARMALHVATEVPAVRAWSWWAGRPASRRPRRAERREQDHALAARIRDKGVGWFVGRGSPSRCSPGCPGHQIRGRTPAQHRRGAGASLELAGTGSQRPLWSALPGIDVPVLVMAGEDDERYAAIARRTAAAIGANAHVALVRGRPQRPPGTAGAVPGDGRAVAVGGDRLASRRADLRVPAGRRCSGRQPEAKRQEDPEGELQASRLPQDRDEPPPRAPPSTAITGRRPSGTAARASAAPARSPTAATTGTITTAPTSSPT